MSSASAQLDSQIMKMQDSADELQRANAKVSAVKDDIRQRLRRLEAARSLRAELEKVRSSKVDEVEDPRYAALYDWFVSSSSPSVKVKIHSWPRYTAAIVLHQSVLASEAFRVESENELQLAYGLTSTSEPCQLNVNLIFVPNTRQLADAGIGGIEEYLSHLVDPHVRSNDVRGLLAAVLARVRGSGFTR